MLTGVRHAALTVTDLPRALAFYREGLGFRDYHVSDRDWAMLELAGTTLSLVKVGKKPTAPAERAAHPAHLGITAESRADVDAFHESLKAKGVRVGAIEEHRDQSYGFYFTDPDGNQLELIHIEPMP